jgi:hypothetical protein
LMDCPKCDANNTAQKCAHEWECSCCSFKWPVVVSSLGTVAPATEREARPSVLDTQGVQMFDP